MTRWDVCNRHLETARPSRFLEIGVDEGKGGKAIKAHIEIGVEPWLESSATAGYTRCFAETSDSFFSWWPDSPYFSVVLIDGLHHFDQVIRDIGHSLNVLIPNGLIVVHDCNPPNEASQMVPRPKRQNYWSGDVWKAITWLRSCRQDLQIYTIDSDTGLGLISCAREPQPTFEIPDNLTWEGLVQHRMEWLGLVPAEALACR